MADDDQSYFERRPEFLPPMFTKHKPKEMREYTRAELLEILDIASEKCWQLGNWHGSNIHAQAAKTIRRLARENDELRQRSEGDE